MPMSLVLREMRYMRSRLRANLITAPLATPFDALILTWGTVSSQELELEMKIEDADAIILDCDDNLDDFVDSLAAAVDRADKGDKNQTFKALFFGNTIPSRFKRPILGKQLTAMIQWVTPLTASTNTAFTGLAARLTPLLDRANAAIATKAQAQADLATFRVGPKLAFYDDVNTQRRTAFTALAQIPVSNKELGLPASYPDRFVRHRTAKPEPSMKSLADDLDSAKGEVTRIQGLIDARNADAKASMDRSAKVADLEKQITDATKGQDDAAAKLTALKEQLAKL